MQQGTEVCPSLILLVEKEKIPLPASIPPFPTKGSIQWHSGVIFSFWLFKKWVMCSLLQMCDLRSILRGLAYVPSCFRQFSFFPILGHGEIKERMEAKVVWVVRSQCDPHEKHQAQNRCLWMHFTPSPIPSPRYRVSSDPRRGSWWSGQQPSTQKLGSSI